MTDPTSSTAWHTHSTLTIALNEKLAVTVRRLDVIGYLTQDDPPNPLLAVVARRSENPLSQDPAALAAIHRTLDTLLLRVMLAPPLLEQGHPDGISLSSIPFAYKFAIFSALLGGEAALAQAAGFPD